MYLSGFQSQRQLIIHHGFQVLVVLIAISLIAFALDFSDCPLSREVAFDCNMASIDDKMLAFVGGDA
jgi:hypothetical protein